MDAARKSVDRLIKKYVIAVGLLVLLTLVRHWVDKYAVEIKREDAQLINISGRQRMLSQKLTKTALLMAEQNDATGFVAFQDTLRKDHNALMQAHQALQHGDSLLSLSSRDHSDDIRKHFEALEVSYRNINQQVAILQAIGYSGNPSAEEDAIRTLVLQEAIFLPVMETITKQFTIESNERLKQTENIELGLMIFTLVLIAIDALYIFMPSVRNVRNTLDELKVVHTHLQNANDEATALNEELTSTNEELRAINDQLEIANETISEQNQTIIRQKEERLNRVLDNSSDVIWSIDLSGSGDNYISRSAEKIFHKPLSELMMKRGFWHERAIDEDIALVNEALARLEKEGSAECRFRIRNANNEVRWLYCRPRIVDSGPGTGLREEGILQDITALEETTQAVKRYQENLDIIFHNTEEGILLLDHRGKVVLFNSWYERFIFGVSGIKPAVGIPFLSAVAPYRRAYAAALFSKAMRGEPIVTQAEFKSTSGKIIHSVRYQPIFSGDKVTHVCITSHDITAQIKQEMAIRQSEANLRTIFDNTKEGFIFLAPDLSIIAFNNAAHGLIMSGHDRSDVTKKSILDFMSLSQQKDFHARVAQAQQEKDVTYETEYVDDASRPLWMLTFLSAIRLDNRDLIGYCVTFHDYTEQKRAERALLERDERFRALIENSGDIIALGDANRHIIYVNESVEKITGYSPEEFKALAGEMLIHPDDVERFRAFNKEVKASPGKLVAGTFRFLTKKKEWQWLEGTCLNLKDVESVRGIVTNFRDVTTRKKVEDEKNALVNQLTEQNNDLIQFSFIASHNLRGPVASMLGLLSLLKSPRTSPDMVVNIHGMLEQSVSRLDSVIRDLANILSVRNSSLHAREWVILEEIVEMIKSSLQMQLEHNNATITINDDAAQSFYTIKSYFHSILYNLISNALKFHSPERPPLVEINTFTSARSVGFTLRDNGVGVDLERYGDKMFMLYQRLHLEVEGKGIGLYMVKTQVQMLNGTIAIDSTPGVGTTFTIQFPVKEQQLA